MNTWRIVVGDALERLQELDAGSVQTCVTSPPYFGLRDYGTGSWEGGDEGCDHTSRPRISESTSIGRSHGGTGPTQPHIPSSSLGVPYRDICGKCDATRTDSQLGLEATPDEYVARLVEVFREVRRVLRDDGTLWLNLGDSYNANPSGGMRGSTLTKGGRQTDYSRRARQNLPRGPSGNADPEPGQPHQMDRGSGATPIPRGNSSAAKHKDLLGIPWSVAFALRADGWYLRSDIIWAKPNPMPESVTDRPTKAHEYVFLLSKSKSYFYDADAVREDAEYAGGRGATNVHGDLTISANATKPQTGLAEFNRAGRNKRSVWTVATAPFPGAHFAVFPPKLIEPCVLAGSAETACGVCGAPWERVTERTAMVVRPAPKREAWQASGDDHARTQLGGTVEQEATSTTIGFASSCDHQDKTGTSTVLDPFAGAGTTGLVATRLGRSFIGIELNPEYAELARDRIRDDAPLMNYLIEAS